MTSTAAKDSSATDQRVPTFLEREWFAPTSPGVLAVRSAGREDVRLHSHDFLEIAVVSAGTGCHVSAFGTHRLNPGDVWVLRPGTWHGYRDCDDALVIGTLGLSLTALRSDAAFLHDIPEIRNLIMLGPSALHAYGVSNSQVSSACADTAVAEISHLQARLAAGTISRVATLAAVLTVLANLVAVTPQSQVPAAPSAVTTLLELFHDHPEREWTMQQLANHVGLVPTYLSRLFRIHVGAPPMACLARIRAERASVLLARTDDPINQVGRQVGWSDPAYFARRFRAQLGMAPSDFRRLSRVEWQQRQDRPASGAEGA